MARRFLLCACENVGIRDCTACGGDDVETFCAIEGASCSRTAVLVAKSAESGFREDFREVRICCKWSVLFGIIAGRRARIESGWCRWRVVEIEWEAGESEGGGEFGEE